MVKLEGEESFSAIVRLSPPPKYIIQKLEVMIFAQICNFKLYETTEFSKQYTESRMKKYQSTQ